MSDRIVWIEVEGRHPGETDEENSEGLYSVPIQEYEDDSDALYELRCHLNISADEDEFGWGRRCTVIDDPTPNLSRTIIRHSWKD